MRWLAWLAALALLAPWPSRVTRSGDSGQLPATKTPKSLSARLLGPVASLAASVQWVRFDTALEAGNYGDAYERAERALALDPSSPHGWDLYASHLVFGRGGELFEPDPVQRVKWIQAGLDVLEEGAQRSRAPGTLRMVRGQILALYVAELASGPTGLPWPGGEATALAEGLVEFDRADSLGHSKAHERKHQAIRAAQLRAESRE